MKRVSPVMLVGLGEAGTNSVKTINQRLLQSAPELAPLVACVTLSTDGTLRDASDEATISVEGLKNDLSDGVFHSNYSQTLKGSSPIAQWLGERFSRLLRQDGRMRLEDLGYSVDTCISLFLVSELSDPIGSSCAIPILAIVQELLAGRMRGAAVDASVLGFLPDVFPESRNSPEAYARAYTFIQELEFIAENPTSVGVEGNPPFSNIFLFSSRNEDGVEIASAEELIVMAGEFLSGLLRGDIASDASYSLALTKEVEGKRTRYSSFGLAKLVFPVNQVMDAITQHYELRYIEKTLGDKAPLYNADLISADVKEFVGGTALDRLSALMRTNEAGKTLYSPFQYSGSVNEKVNVDAFMASLDEESEEFAKTTAAEMSRSLAKRRDGLLTEHLERLGSESDKSMNAAERGVYYASGFIDVLRDSPSKFVRDDGTSERYSLSVVEANAKRFFDSTFGIDRTGLSRLKRDLEDKRALLSKQQAELARPEGESKRTASEATTDNAIRESVEALGNEITGLEQRRAKLEGEIAEFDMKLADPAKRRALLQNVLGDETEDRSKKQADLRAVDTNLHSALEALEDMYAQRRALALKLAFLYPAFLAFGIGLISAVRGRIADASLADSLRWGAAALPALLLLYGIGAAVVYFVQMHAKVRAAELLVEKRRGEKRLALLALQNAYTKHFETLFEHELFSGLIGWISEYKTYAATLSATLSEFVETLLGKTEGLKAGLDNLIFPNSPLLRSAVVADDLPTIISSNPEAAHEEESFRRANPLAGFFAGFLEDRNLERLGNSVAAFVESVYANIRKDSIEKVLARTLGPGDRLSTRLNQLYQASKAFIQLEVNQGDDVSQPLVYVGTQNDERSICRDLLTRIGGPATTFYSTGNQYELTAARMKVGFPAYHVALVRYGRNITEAGDAKRFAVDPDWELEDVIPSLYVAGGADDAARILVCLGRAFGIIDFERTTGYAFDGVVLGRTIETAAAELRKASTGSPRNQLNYRIEAAKAAPTAMDQLVKFKTTLRGDSVDLEILTRVINELSPLA
jgi:hypothetical protein